MDTWRRVARALATVEPIDAQGWESRFYRILQDFKFVPGGRILAGVGTSHDVTLFNCFVTGPLVDCAGDIHRCNCVCPERFDDRIARLRKKVVRLQVILLSATKLQAIGHRRIAPQHNAKRGVVPVTTTRSPGLAPLRRTILP